MRIPYMWESSRMQSVKIPVAGVQDEERRGREEGRIPTRCKYLGIYVLEVSILLVDASTYLIPR